MSKVRLVDPLWYLIPETLIFNSREDLEAGLSEEFEYWYQDTFSPQDYWVRPRGSSVSFLLYSQEC